MPFGSTGFLLTEFGYLEVNLISGSVREKEYNVLCYSFVILLVCAILGSVPTSHVYGATLIFG